MVSFYLHKSNQIHRDYVYRILRENNLRCSCCYLNRHIQYNCVGIKTPISVFQLTFLCVAGKNNVSAKQYQETWEHCVSDNMEIIVSAKFVRWH